MWHHATCLVEAKGRRFPAPLAEILPPFYSEWLLAPRPSVMVAARGGGSPTRTAGGERQQGRSAAQRTDQGFLQPKCHLVGKSHCQLPLLRGLGEGGESGGRGGCNFLSWGEGWLGCIFR